MLFQKGLVCTLKKNMKKKFSVIKYIEKRWVVNIICGFDMKKNEEKEITKDTFSFSKRMGLIKSKRIQLDRIDNDLKNSLWNAFIISFDVLTQVSKFKILKRVWVNFLKKAIDTIPHQEGILGKSLKEKKALVALREEYNRFRWNRVYDFVEYINQELLREVEKASERNKVRYQKALINFKENITNFMKIENSAYRLVGNQIIPITNESEIDEIEQVLKSPFEVVSIHIEKSMKLLSDKENPDYPNSIKESISAIEALCKIITEKKKITLGQALKKLEKDDKLNLHPALSKAFQNIYGYTSDASGIRHALSDKEEILLEDANFMLIACSAFANYLIEKYSKVI